MGGFISSVFSVQKVKKGRKELACRISSDSS